jgi:hypothetical protein
MLERSSPGEAKTIFPAACWCLSCFCVSKGEEGSRKLRRKRPTQLSTFLEQSTKKIPLIFA